MFELNLFKFRIFFLILNIILPGHEYAIDNLEFACHVEPENQAAKVIFLMNMFNFLFLSLFYVFIDLCKFIFYAFANNLFSLIKNVHLIYRSLQVYQRSNTQVRQRILSDFTPTNVRPNPPRSE
jgi:hypothetical protein